MIWISGIGVLAIEIWCYIQWRKAGKESDVSRTGKTISPDEVDSFAE